MTSRELADKLEVSERTVHRDMEALSAAGIPVVAERGSGGGWSLAEGYRTDLTGMKSKEMQSLLLAQPSSVLHDLGMTGVFEGAFRKLLASLPEALRQEAEVVRRRIHVDGAGWHEAAGEQVPSLPLVQEAVWAERTLRFRYRRGDGTESAERIVCPLGLVAKNGIWYLVAAADDEVRTFRISRMSGAAMGDEPFERPEPFDLAAYWEESTARFKASLPRYPARIRVREEKLERLAAHRYVKLVKVSPANAGFAEAEAEFNTLESAVEILLGFGASVEAVEPAELRAAVLAEARAIVTRHAGKSEPDR